MLLRMTVAPAVEPSPELLFDRLLLLEEALAALEKARAPWERVIERARRLHNRRSEQLATAKLKDLDRAITRIETMLRTLHAVAWGDSSMDSTQSARCLVDDERRAASTLP